MCIRDRYSREHRIGRWLRHIRMAVRSSPLVHVYRMWVPLAARNRVSVLWNRLWVVRNLVWRGIRRLIWLARDLKHQVGLTAVGPFVTYIRWKGAAQSMIRRASCSVIVLFEENAEGLSLLVARAAKKANVPYIIIPQTIPNLREPAMFYQNAPEHDGERWLARLVGFILPRWIYVFEGKRILRLPLKKVAAQHVLGLAPQRPWILNSGDSELICVECNVLRLQYLALGFPDQQLYVSGHPVDDTLYEVWRERESRRAALEEVLHMPPGRPLLVVGFPPNQYSSPDVTPFEWPTFEAMCHAWVEALATVRPLCNVVIRGHPRLQPSDLKIFEDAGFFVSSQATETLIPMADLYVACISATIRWALALGIPVINYDCYRYRYGDYSD